MIDKEHGTIHMPDRQVFTFDQVFDENTTQSDMFNSVGRESVNDIFDGFNSTIFAYG